MFRSLKRGRKSTYGGRSSNDPAFDDTHMYRCRVCGHPCNAKKVRRRTLTDKDTSGEWASGIQYTSTDEDPNYVNVTGGCPFCGTLDSR